MPQHRYKVLRTASSSKCLKLFLKEASPLSAWAVQVCMYVCTYVQVCMYMINMVSHVQHALQCVLGNKACVTQAVLHAAGKRLSVDAI